MAHFKEKESCITVTLSFFGNLLLEFFFIDVKSRKIAKIKIFLKLKFDLSFQKY